MKDFLDNKTLITLYEEPIRKLDNTNTQLSQKRIDNVKEYIFTLDRNNLIQK